MRLAWSAAPRHSGHPSLSSNTSRQFEVEAPFTIKAGRKPALSGCGGTRSLMASRYGTHGDRHIEEVIYA